MAKRVLGLLFILLAASLVTALIFWAVYPGINVTKEGVKLALEKITNKSVSLEDVRISFSPTSFFNITIEGLAIEFPEVGSSVSVKSINLKPSVVSLMKLRVLISSITVEGLRASLTMAEGDHVTAFPIPIPLGGFSSAEGDSHKPQVQEDRVQEVQEPAEETPGKTQPPVQLQIDLVRIADARVEFFSAPTNKAKAGSLTFSDISGEIRREKEGLDYAFEFKGKIDNEKTPSPFSCHGLVKLADRQFPIAEAQIDMAANDVLVEPWVRMMSSFPIRSDAITLKSLKAKLSFQSDKPCSVAFDASIKGQSDQAALMNAKIDIEPSKNLNAIERINIHTRIEGLPIQLVQDSLGDKPPLTFSSGLINGEFKWLWQPQGWSTSGSVRFDGLASGTASILFSLPWTGTGEWEGDDKHISLKNFHLTRDDTSVKLSGAIGELFSTDPALNFDCRGSIGAKLIAALLGDTVRLAGFMAVTAHVKGSLNDLRVEANTDWAPLDLARLPFFQKKSGASATTNFTGRILKTGNARDSHRRLEGQLKGAIGAVKIGKDVNTESSLSVPAEFHAKVFAKANNISFSDIFVTLGRFDSPHKILSITGQIQNFGSPAETFNFQSKAALGKTLFTAFPVLPKDVALTGDSNVSVKISGTRKRLSWNLVAPINGIGLKYKETALKQPGIPANVTATGIWNEGRNILTNGELSSPGLLVSAAGELLNREGKFQHLDLEIRKADLAHIRKLFPDPTLTMAGSVLGHIKIKPTADAITATGSLRLSNVALGLSKPNSIGCSGMKGVVEIMGNKMRTDELTGAITGIVNAPLKLRGEIDSIDSLDQLSGDVFVNTGKGKIRTDFLAAATVLGDVLGPRAAAAQQLLEIEAGSASVKIQSGQAETQDLRVKGPAIAVGAIGSYRFKDADMNAILSIQTRMFENLPIGNVPVVRDFLKQHEGFLKALGVDKELSKYGIRLPQAQRDESAKPNAQASAPVTLMFTLRGPIQGPQLLPVLESSLDKKKVNTLKKLSEL